MGKGLAIKDCYFNAFVINARTTKHNQLRHPENLMVDGNHLVNLGAATTRQSNEVTSSRQIIQVTKESDSSRVNNKFSLIVYQRYLSSIRALMRNSPTRKGTDVMLRIAGIHGKTEN